jgi:hypothetical protein
VTKVKAESRLAEYFTISANRTAKVKVHHKRLIDQRAQA